jgi:signal transduction histidine kinase
MPLAFVGWRTYEGLHQEEQAQMRFFAETFFDRMEMELAGLVEREENRAVDEYHYNPVRDKDGLSKDGDDRSPLAETPVEPYILGYIQNNPDGSFRTPLVADMGLIPPGKQDHVKKLKEINRIFNSKKFAMKRPRPTKRTTPGRPVAAQVAEKEKEDVRLDERFLSRSRSKSPKGYLGQKEARVEEITARQVLNIAPEADSATKTERKQTRASSREWKVGSALKAITTDSVEMEKPAMQAEPDEPQRFQVEVAPFQSVFIRDDQVYIFRRIAINNQIYRQGFILLVRPFLRHLTENHFSPQPLARFSGLRLQVMEYGYQSVAFEAGNRVEQADFSAERTFPAPFDFLSARLLSESVPPSPARGPLNIALTVLGAIMLLGLFAIYHSARTVVDMSERRSQFVSSVTHELKTPLTNIRMYIEMLEQGIAATPERERDYLGILDSESARLSRLINNVLELSKLEKKQRQFHMQEGRLNDVFEEVPRVMSQKLKQEGFSLEIKDPDIPLFSYDREVLVQILINLIENSVKFGRQSPERRITIGAKEKDGWVSIEVSDTGPGIPRNALKRVFDDFYRVDNDLTRTTGGTGIGLALVKKFIQAMEGRVKAFNNPGAGCTIALSLPMRSGTKN